MGEGLAAQKKFKEAIPYYKASLEGTKMKQQSNMYETIIDCICYCYLALEDYKNLAIYSEKIDGKYEYVYRFEDQGFRYLINADEKNIYYQIKSLKKVQPGIVQVWLKWYWDGQTLPYKIFKELPESSAIDSKRKKEIERQIKIYKSEHGGERFCLELSQFDLNNDKSRRLVFNVYDENGDVLSNKGFSNKNAEWGDTIPGSVGEGIIQKLAKKIK